MPSEDHVPKSAIETDLSHFPLVVVRMPDVALRDEDLNLFVADQRAMLKMHKPHAVIGDARHARAVSPLQRKILAAWLEEAEPLNRAYTVCIGIVVDNAIIRGALTAVLWLRQPGALTKVFPTVEEAAEWALSELTRARVPDLGPVEDFVRGGKRTRRAAP